MGQPQHSVGYRFNPPPNWPAPPPEWTPPPGWAPPPSWPPPPEGWRLWTEEDKGSVGTYRVATAGGAAPTARRRPRGAIVVGVVFVVLLIGGVVLFRAVVSGTQQDNYCLLSVGDNFDGTTGVLAVPQADATQSVCDSVAESTQEDVGDEDAAGSFVIDADRPGYLTPYQQNNMLTLGFGSADLVYSGTVLGQQAGSGGSVKG
jgi:hypothetical protein